MKAWTCKAGHPRGARLQRRWGARGWLPVAWLALAAPGAAAADRALLVGVDQYADARVHETPGSEADARDLAELLRARFGFAGEGIKLLLGPQATGDAIVAAFREWLIAATAPGDRVFFHYAGHGSQLPDDDGDELDGFDETLAPYDTVPDTGAHEIRDDEFGRLMAALAGRRVVMLFDSCHSGTISRAAPVSPRLGRFGGARYLPDPRQFVELQRAEAAGAAYTAVGASDERGQRAGGSTFLGARELGSVTGAVVISASAPQQTVYPVEVGGDVRGALSYLFAQLHRDGVPSVSALRDGLTARVKALQQARKLMGVQEPQTEIISPVPLDDQPLFASWDVPQALQDVNAGSRWRLRLGTVGGYTTYAPGVSLAYEVRSSAAGHLYLLLFASDRSAACLFPGPTDDGRVGAGGTVIPRPGTPAIEAGEPLGRDLVVALVTAQPLRLDCGAAYTWDTLLQGVGLPALRRAVLRSGVDPAGRAAAFDWQAAAVMIETVAP